MSLSCLSLCDVTAAILMPAKLSWAHKPHVLQWYQVNVGQLLLRSNEQSHVKDETVTMRGCFLSVIHVAKRFCKISLKVAWESFNVTLLLRNRTSWSHILPVPLQYHHIQNIAASSCNREDTEVVFWMWRCCRETGSRRNCSVLFLAVK